MSIYAPLRSIGFALLEAEGLCKPEASLVSAPQLRVVLKCDGSDPYTSAPGKLASLGSIVWHECGCFPVPISDEDLRIAELQVEVIDVRRNVIAVGSLRLAWVHSRPGHTCSSFLLPLRPAFGSKQSTLPGTATIHMSVFCVSPGSAAPPSFWVKKRILEEAKGEATPERPPKRVMDAPIRDLALSSALKCKPRLPASWSRVRFDFVVASFWDLASRETWKTHPKLSFRIEVVGNKGNDELILLDDLQETCGIPKPIGRRSPSGMCFDVLQKFSGEVELPQDRETARLVILVMDPSSQEERILGESKLPLAREWPWIDKEHLQTRMIEDLQNDADVGNDGTCRSYALEAEIPMPDVLGKAPFFKPSSLGEVPILKPTVYSSSPDPRIFLPGVACIGALGVAGASGLMKCAYRIESISEEIPDDGCTHEQSFAESCCGEDDASDVHETLSNDEASAAKSHLVQTAARHTYDVGYSKWERFDVEAALTETVAKSDATPSAQRKREKVKRKRDHAQSAPQVEEGAQLAIPKDWAFDIDQLKKHLQVSDDSAPVCKPLLLRLHVHRGFYFGPLSGGDEHPHLYLAVTVGETTTFLEPLKSATSTFRHEILSPIFKGYQQRHIQLPGDARLELRLKQRYQGHSMDLGATVIDLQDRYSSEILKLVTTKEQGASETRTLYPVPKPGRYSAHDMAAVGSLELSAELVDPNDVDIAPASTSLWADDVKSCRAEVRVSMRSLHVIGSTMGNIAAASLITQSTLEIPVQCLSGEEQPAPQLASVHVVGEKQTLAVFPKTLTPGEAKLVISFFQVSNRPQIMGSVVIDAGIALSGYLENHSCPEDMQFRTHKLVASNGDVLGEAQFLIQVLPQQVADSRPMQQPEAPPEKVLSLLRKQYSNANARSCKDDSRVAHQKINLVRAALGAAVSPSIKTLFGTRITTRRRRPGLCSIVIVMLALFYAWHCFRGGGHSQHPSTPNGQCARLRCH